MENTAISPFMAKLIILIDTLQMMGFSIHPSLPFIWNNTLMNYVRSSIKYFQLDSLLRGATKESTHSIIFVIFGFTLLMNAFIIYVCFLIVKGNDKPAYLKIRSIVIKPLSFYILIQPSVLASSFSQAFFVVII